MKISLAVACLSSLAYSQGADEVEKLSPGDYKVFVLNFDLPVADRYRELYEHFEPQLRLMEDHWWNHFYAEETRSFFTENIEALKLAQPDAYEANLVLAEFLGLDVAQTFGVSAITEISTYCTSIVARNSQGEIAHVRNLDFHYTDVMKQLVYEAHLKKDGKVVAVSPLIAGFYGAFTGQREGAFSISYDARERKEGPTHEIIFDNLARNLDHERTPEGEAILKTLLELDNFQDAVEYLSTVPMTSPGHFIIGGVSGNEGVVLTRNADSTDHRFELSDSQWYIAMTNVDVWEQDDKRFDNAIKFLEELGQDNFEPDGQSLIENVLWRDGVIQDDSIFTAAISAYPGTQVTIYDAPSDAKFDAVWSPVDIFSTV